MPKKRHSPPVLDLRRAILQYISDHPDRPMKAKPLAKALGVPDSQYSAFRALLRQLLADGALHLGRGRTLHTRRQTEDLVGVYRATRREFGFVTAGVGRDIYIAAGRQGGALDGDTVAVRLLGSGPRGLRSGEVLRIVQRGSPHYVGVLDRAGAQWFVQPQGPRNIPAIEIADPTAKSARQGDMVVVELIDATAQKLRGVITERLGAPTSAQVKILSVIRRHDIPERFPEPVRQAAAAAAASFSEREFVDREDLRNEMIITIDPKDARDFDDAFSIRALSGGLIELAVHIADVTHFVHPDSPIDREARLRGTSVYFPGYVVPMLPEVLSNGVCSLQPGQPRLTKSVFITYDRQAQVLSARCSAAVIQSAARLTYEQASAALEGDSSAVSPEVRDLLRQAERLARRIQQRRLADSMIVLNLPEAYLELDDSGEVRDSRPADTSFSHTLIEMFMVEANEAVSRLLTAESLPHLRRVHPPPPEEAEERFAQLLRAIDPSLNPSLERYSIQKIVNAMRNKPAERAVHYLLLRSMAQAYYSPARMGHFALASEDYCHFTSPIRRYPDINVHRALNTHLYAESHARRELAEVLPDSVIARLGEHASSTERRAQQAEREARHSLLVGFMKSKLGQTLDGVITGVASFGVFVQVLPYLAEGFIAVGEFGSDDWAFEDRAGVFTGRRSGRVITIGQPVRVQVAAVDELRQQIRLTPEAGIGLRPGHRIDSGRKRGRKAPGRAQQRAGGGRARGRSSRGRRGRR